MKGYAILAAVVGTFGYLVLSSGANKDELIAAAPKVWADVGYQVVGYEGYQWCKWWGAGYGGACVWHALKANPDNGIRYTGFIKKWGDEYHVYGPTAVDAIKPR